MLTAFEMEETIMRALKQIQDDLAAQKLEMKNMEGNITQAINNNIDEKFNIIESRTRQLEIKVDQQQATLDILEKQIRRKNILFFGIEETERNYNDLQNLILDTINNIMQVQCQQYEIETVRRMGKRNERTRPIVVTLTTLGKKIELLKKSKFLENTNFYIKEDYPPKVLQKRKELQEELRRQRELGNNVSLRYDRIITLEKREPKLKNDTSSGGVRTNKRLLSKSPEVVVESSINEGSNAKQIPKRNKISNNITSYLHQPNNNKEAPSALCQENKQYGSKNY